ncbi:MAG: DUF952 domain-containing protein [Chloroflexi bacterium]|nr:DUF952 domain-containing protein [Chloroflexota bacterium]MCC6893750.1 DUF952 domain-containing protein [Anaerolineae bacterium]
MSTILHITSLPEWETALENGTYTAPSLAKEGFIHCSTREQVLPVANNFYRGQTNLVLLVMDTEQVQAPLKWEGPINPVTGQPEVGNDKLFPHIYGAINVEAVVKVVAFPPKADGSFELPEL